MKTIIYYIRQFFNFICTSSGVSCIICVFKNKLTDNMDFIIGGIGVLSFVYGFNKWIELYKEHNKEK